MEPLTPHMRWEQGGCVGACGCVVVVFVWWGDILKTDGTREHLRQHLSPQESKHGKKRVDMDAKANKRYFRCFVRGRSEVGHTVLREGSEIFSPKARPCLATGFRRPKSAPQRSARAGGPPITSRTTSQPPPRSRTRATSASTRTSWRSCGAYGQNELVM